MPRMTGDWSPYTMPAPSGTPRWCSFYWGVGRTPMPETTGTTPPYTRLLSKGRLMSVLVSFFLNVSHLMYFDGRFLGNMTKNLFLTKIIWFCGIDKRIIWIAFLKFCQKSYENQKTWFCKHLKYGLNMKWQDNNPTSIVKAVLLLEKQASLIDDHAELKTSSIDFFQTQCLQSQKTRYFHPY